MYMCVSVQRIEGFSKCGSPHAVHWSVAACASGMMARHTFPEGCLSSADILADNSWIQKPCLSKCEHETTYEVHQEVVHMNPVHMHPKSRQTPFTLGPRCRNPLGPASWGPKSSKIGAGGALGRLWAPCWPKMAPRAKKSPKIHRKCTQNGPNLEAKIHQKSVQKRSKMWLVFCWVWEWIFRASCGQVGTKLGAKTLPKWSQVGSKIEASWSMVWEPTFWSMSAGFFMILGLMLR